MSNKVKLVKIGDLSKHVAIAGVLTIVATQVFACIFCLFTKSVFGIDNPIVLLAILIITESLGGVALILLVLHPTAILSDALVQVSGEYSTKTPPNINDLHGIDKNELALCLKVIYQQTDSKPDDAAAKNNTATNILQQLPVGIITLNDTFNIVYANDLAPVYSAEGHRFIKLDFSTDALSLEKWLINAKQNTLHANHVWTRIQDAPAGSTENRHIYDVVASYQRNTHGSDDITIITIDRTDDYVESENNMDFITLAAHELRGPITTIRGYLDILEEQTESTATAEQKMLMARLNVSARRLASYVNNILNTSRYDRRHLKLKLAETKVADIVNYIREDMELRATTVNRSVDWQIPANLPTVAADRSSISEVLSNLVDNAIKYSRDGGKVLVTATTSGRFVEISVIDHGIGIPQSVAEHLFSKFYRSHRSSGSTSGSGLGLYISRAIVESHGGQISFQSTEGKGSTFAFTLPIYSYVRSQLESNQNSNAGLVSQNNVISNHGRMVE